MLYLVGQITVILFLATIAGMLLGWWSRGLRIPRATVESMFNTADPFEARARLEQCHRDNALLRRELKEAEEQLTRLRTRVDRRSEMELVDRLQNAEARAEALLQDLQWRDDTIAALKRELEQSRFNG